MRAPAQLPHATSRRTSLGVGRPSPGVSPIAPTLRRCNFTAETEPRITTASITPAAAGETSQPSTSTAGPPSSYGSSTSGPSGSGRKSRRLVLARDDLTINWDRWQNNLFRRIEAYGEGEGEDEDEDSYGEGEEGEADGSLAARLAAPDLAAAYFQRWDDPAVHQPMLQDRMLVGAWRDALSAAPPGALAGKVVLDVGCGLGLLAMLAAKAGAARVIAVDGSAGAVEAARRIVKANGLEEKITVVHGMLECLSELPDVSPGEVDVVVSQWMGPGLLAGGGAHAVAHAVSTWLRPGGLVLPDRVSLWAAALEDREALQEAKEGWRRVAGMDMSAALGQAIKHPRRDVLTRKAQLLSAPQQLAAWRAGELRPDSLLDPQTGAFATCPLRLTAVREERLFGLVLWWEAEWSFGGQSEGAGGSAPVRFSTHPLAATTRYQQLMLDFPRTARLAVDDEVGGQLVLRPGAVDPRDLEIELEVTLPEAAGQQPIKASYRVSHLM